MQSTRLGLSRIFNKIATSQWRRKINLNFLGISFLFGGIISQTYQSKKYVFMSNNKESASQLNQQLIQPEEFSNELYQKYLTEKYDIIILYDSDRFTETFQQEVLLRLTTLVILKGGQKARKIKVLNLKKLNQEEQLTFEQKYGCFLEYDTILLLRNKYLPSLNSFGAQDYFENKEYLVRYFEKLNKIKKENFEGFNQLLKFLPQDNVIILLQADKSSKFYKNLQRRLSVIQLHQIYSRNPNIHWFVIDNTVSEKLGLRDGKEGQLYFLMKSQPSILNKSNYIANGKKFYLTEAASLQSKKVNDVITENSQKFNEVSVFSTRSFEVPNPKYSIILEGDMNKLPRSEWKSLVNILSQLREHLKSTEPDLAERIEFVNVNRNIEKYQQKYRLLIRDDQKTIDRVQEHSTNSLEEMKQLSTYNEFNQPHSYLYQLKGDVSLSAMKQFFNDVKSGNSKEYFKSQARPKYRKFSVKLCGNSFQQEVIEHEQTCFKQVIFHYSKNCHACKQYGSDYEKFALNSLIQKQEAKFCRLNSDRNQLSVSQNFPYTPVFQVCKQGVKDKPYIYRNQKFTPDLLRQFIEVTSQFQLVQEDDFRMTQKLSHYINII